MATLVFGTDITSKSLLKEIPEERLAFIKIKHDDQAYPRLLTHDKVYENTAQISAIINGMMPMMDCVIGPDAQFSADTKRVISWISANKLNKYVKRQTSKDDVLKIKFQRKEYVGFDAIVKRFKNLKEELLDNNMPNYFERMKTLKAAAKDAVDLWKESKGIRATDKVEKYRLSICDPCDYKRDPLCAKCGCYINKKVKLVSSFCPIGKWGIEESCTR